MWWVVCDVWWCVPCDVWCVLIVSSKYCGQWCKLCIKCVVLYTMWWVVCCVWCVLILCVVCCVHCMACSEYCVVKLCMTHAALYTLWWAVCCAWSVACIVWYAFTVYGVCYGVCDVCCIVYSAIRCMLCGMAGVRGVACIYVIQCVVSSVWCVFYCTQCGELCAGCGVTCGVWRVAYDLAICVNVCTVQCVSWCRVSGWHCSFYSLPLTCSNAILSRYQIFTSRLSH